MKNKRLVIKILLQAYDLLEHKIDQGMQGGV